MDYIEHRHYLTLVTRYGEPVWSASCFCGYVAPELYETKAEASRVLTAHALDGQYSLVLDP